MLNLICFSRYAYKYQTMIYIAGTSIALFLSFLLFLKKYKSKADIVLIIWLFVSAVHQLLFYFDISGFSKQHTFLAGLNVPFPFLHGPLLFLYILTFLNVLSKNFLVYTFHFIPFIASFLYFIPFYFSPEEIKIYNVGNNLIDFSSNIRFNYYAVLVSGFSYILLSLLYLRKYRKQLQNKNSKAININRWWLLFLILSTTVIWMFIFLGNVMQIFIVVMINTVIIGIIGIRNTPFFVNPITLGISSTTINKINRIRYEKSGLTFQKKKHIYLQLQRIMTEEKIFTDCELTLDKLALKVNIHPNYLSQYINEELKMTFYDFINRYRVEEFKRITNIPENNKFNILALSYECGFNSKSSFNRNFKKVTGYTPSEYLRKTNLSFQ